MGSGLFRLYGIVSTAQAGDLLCDGFTGASKGLCNTVAAIGCFEDPSLPGYAAVGDNFAANPLRSG